MARRSRDGEGVADTTTDFVDKAKGSAHQISMTRNGSSSVSNEPSAAPSVARPAAVDKCWDQRLFALDAERYDGFVKALDNPPAPGPKLRTLLNRIPM